MKQRFLKSGLFLLFSLSLAVVSRAQEKEAVKLPSDSLTYTEIKGDPLKTRIYTLRNGLTVMLTVNKREPRIQTLIAVKAGSMNDPNDNTGLAHYLEHMLFKGTRLYGTMGYESEEPLLKRIEATYEAYRKTQDPARRKQLYHIIDSLSFQASKYSIANEYDKMMQLLGAQGTNAFTSTDATVYINDIPSNQLDKWITIEAERFRQPVFRLFHTELEAVYEEKNISMDDDDSKAYQALMEGVFSGYPYGTQTTIGTVEHLKNPSLQEIRKFYNTWYVANNMAIIMAGDFDPDEVIQRIERSFAYMTNRNLDPSMPFKFNTQDETKYATVTGPNPAYVMIGFPMQAASNENSLYLYLVDMLLANSKAGLIDLNLNNAQKVLSASSFLQLQKEGSMHVLQGYPKEGQTLDEVKDLLLAQIDLIKKGEFDEQTLKAIIENDEVSEINNYKSNTGRAFELLDAYTNGISWGTYLARKEKLKTVTKKEIVDFANFWYGNNYTVIKKVTGEDSTVQKIEKPAITPVELNTKNESAFLKKVTSGNTVPIAPVFLDFEKDILKTKTARNIPLYYIHNKENKLFSLYYVLEMGRLNDLKTAFAINLLPYLGTEKFTSSQINTRFYELACNFGVSSGDNRIYVYLSGPDKNFAAALGLFEELISQVKPDQEALNNLVERTLKSREDAKLEKRTILFSAMMNYAMYGKDNPYTYRLSEQELKTLKAEDLTARIKDLFSYQHNAFYFGPQTPLDVEKILDDKHIAPATLKAYPPAKVFVPLPPSDKNTVFFVDYEMVQAEVLWLRNAGKFDEKQLPATQLFNEYFDGGMGAVVFQELRESKALAYSTYAAFNTTSEKEKPNYILGYIGTQSDKLFDAVPAMNKLFNTPPANDKVLVNAKKSLKQKLEAERILETDIFFNYLAAGKLGLTTDMRKQTYEQVESLGVTDIARFQSDNFKDKAFVYCVIGSKKRIDKKQLKSLGKVKVLTLEEIFGY